MAPCCIPETKESFDQLDNKQKHAVKVAILKANSIRFCDIINPNDLLYYYRYELINRTTFADLQKLAEKKNDNSVICELLAQIQKHHQEEQPPWWERLDTVLKETDNWELYRDLNPWLSSEMPGSDTAGPQRQPGTHAPSQPMSVDTLDQAITPLVNTEGMANLCDLNQQKLECSVIQPQEPVKSETAASKSDQLSANKAYELSASKDHDCFDQKESCGPSGEETLVFLSIEDNTRQLKVLNVSHPQKTDFDQTTQVANRDMEVDCSDAMETALDLETDGSSIRSPSSTYLKERWVDNSRQVTRLSREIMQSSAENKIFYINSENVYIGETEVKNTSAHVTQEAPARHQQENYAQTQQLAEGVDRSVDLKCPQPKPWENKMHKTEPKVILERQVINSSDTITEESRPTVAVSASDGLVDPSNLHTTTTSSVELWTSQDDLMEDTEDSGSSHLIKHSIGLEGRSGFFRHVVTEVVKAWQW